MPVFYPQVTHRVSGNTAGAMVDISSGTYVLAGGNNITLSQVGNSVTISGGAGGAGDGGNILAAGTRTAGSNSSVLFSNAGGVTFGLDAVNGSVMTASHNGLTTAALSNHSHGNPTLALTNLTGTTASASDGFTLSLSAAAPGGGAGATVSRFYNMLGEPIAGTTTLSLGGSSVFVQPFVMPVYVSASYLRIAVSIAIGSTTLASTANTTLSMNQSVTQFFCIYSQGVGASSRSIQSLYSSSVSLRFNVDYRIGAASNNQSCSHAFTYPATGNSSVTFSTSYTPAASSIVRVSTTHLTAFTGGLFLDIPYASLMTPGNYWMAYQLSSASAVTGAAGLGNATSRGSFVAISQISSNIREMGANTTVGSNMWWGMGQGWWTTNTVGRTTDSMALSQISTIANQPIVPFIFERFA